MDANEAFHSFFFALLALVAASRPCLGEDLSGRFGLSGNFAAVVPTSPDYVTDMTDSVGIGFGGTASYDMGPHIGIALSYDRFSLGNSKYVSMTNMLFRARFKPEERGTPTLEFGPGSAWGVESSRMENFSFKALLGYDYFTTPDCAIGPQLGYFFVSHSGDATTYVHLLTFGLRATYYFGRT